MDTLRDAIEQSGLSRAEVVRRAGVSKAGLFNWLAGRSHPRKINILRLSRVLNVEPDTLDPQYYYCVANKHLNPERDSRGRCEGCLRDAQLAYRETKNKRIRDKRRDRKLRVFEKYGNECVCCGEDNLFFLHIDHVNNDGNIERGGRGSGGGDRLYTVLDKKPRNERYQILCANCNMGKHLNDGVCPHQTEVGDWYD